MKEMIARVGDRVNKDGIESVCLTAEELVRCKDCVYWDKGHSEECDNINSICFHNGWCKPDWFCADGERKEGR